MFFARYALGYWIKLTVFAISPSIDPPYPIYGGIFRKEAIMLLRRFYIQENEKGTPASVPPSRD